jgi:hypothetical protein
LKLGEILRTISFAKSVPEGLKLLECKRGVGGKNSLIRYIPEKDPVQEALKMSKKTNYFKLMLPNMGSELKVALWASGTPEQFVLHVRSAIHALKQMEHDIKYLNAKEAVATSNLDLDIKKEEYAQVRTSKRKKNKGNSGEGMPAVSESLVAAKTAYDKAKQALEATKLAAMMETAKAFELCEIYYPMRPGSLGKRLSRPKRLNVPGKTSTESLMTKLLPRPGTPLWSASRSTYSRCSGMMRAKPKNIISRIH